MAHRHRVLPLLHAGLRRSAAHPPPDVLARLEAAHMSNAARTTILIAEAVRLTDWFDAAGIRHLLWRGPAIAAAAYPEPAIRQFDDLDFLVHPDDIVRACLLLNDHGYRPHVRLRPAQLSAYLRSGWDYVATSTGGDHWVELAGAVTPAFFAFDVPFELLWASRRTVPLQNRAVSAPSDAHHLLLAAAHGSKHLWQRFQWIADVQGLLCASPAAISEDLFALARASGGHRMLLLGLAMARRLMDAPLPPAQTQSSRAIPRWAAWRVRPRAGWMAPPTPPPARARWPRSSGLSGSDGATGLARRSGPCSLRRMATGPPSPCPPHWPPRTG